MVAVDRTTTRSVSLSRKSRLLCATALVGVLLPLTTAQAQNVRYAETGTYNNDIVAPYRGTATVSTAEDTVATYVGNLTFQEAASLFVGDRALDNGTIVFAPESISSPVPAPGTVITLGQLQLRAGTLRFGNAVGREFFARENTNIVISGGTLDLAGADQHIHNLVATTNQSLTNSTVDTVAVLSLTTGSIQQGLNDGAGSIRLRKTGSGTLTVDGANSFSGGTEIAYGTVRMLDARALGSGAIAFNSNGPSASGLSFLLRNEAAAVENDLIISGTAGALLDIADGRSAILSGVISGAGQLIKYGNGTLVLAGKDHHTGGTDVQFGTLVLASGEAIADDSHISVGTFGTLQVAQTEAIDRITGNGSIVIGDATLIVGGYNGDSIISGVISGDAATVQLRKEGTGTLELLRENTYSGKTHIRGGRVVAGASQAFGTGAVEFIQPSEGRNVLELTNGVNLSNVMLFGSHVILENNDFATLSGILEGNRGLAITKMGRGTISLSGHNDYIGPQAIVREGALSFDGRFNNNVEAAFGGTVTGSGYIDGHVEIADGGRLYGQYDRTLTMASLTLNENSDIEILVDEPGTQAFFEIQGDLVLDGRLAIDDDVGTAFGRGVYRLFNYGGSLTDNGLEVVGLPDDSEFDIGDIEIQTAIDKQVNIVVDGDPGPGPDPRPNTQFWDGSGTTADGVISGGYGIWRTGTTNWTRTNGEVNDSWGGRFAVFQGEPGTITVSDDDGDISITGMQFAIDGYRVEGDAITLAEQETLIRVGDGSQAGTDYTATIASELRGDGALVKDDLGTLVLTGQNSYRGDTIVRSGTLVGDTGSIRNNIANNGHVIFDQEQDAVFSGTISGRGTMGKRGEGTLILDSRSALDWAIEEGGLVSRADLLGGNLEIAEDAFMRFDQNASGIYHGMIAGSGDFQVAIGVGNRLRLTGDSSAFAGETTVTGGSLVVDGRLGGFLSMQDGTVLAGAGTVGTTYIASGATVAPGTGAGTLTVAGDFTQASGSLYEVDADADGTSDLIDVSGTATLEGGAVHVLAGTGNYAAASQYTILAADGGVFGAYTGGVTSNLAFLDPSLSYDANNVYLTMTRNEVGFVNVGNTRNQKAAGAAIESLGAGNAVHDAVLNLSGEQARDAFDRLSGEVHASVKTAMLEDSRFIRDAVMNRIRAAFGDTTLAVPPVMEFDDGSARLSAANTDTFAMWAQAFGSWGHWEGNGNAASFSRDAGGLLVGGDAYVADWRLGLVAGYSHSSFSLGERSSSGSSDNYHLGLYGGRKWGKVGFRSGVAYSWHDIDTSRSVSFPGFSEKLEGSYHAGTFQAFGEVGYRLDVAPKTVFEPFADLAHVSLKADGFTETGGGAALTGGSQTVDTTFTTLGLRASHGFAFGTIEATARGMVGWRHAFGDTVPTAAHAFVGGQGFAVAGVPIGEDIALIEAGMDFAISQSATLGFSYNGQFASDVQDQTVKANFNMRF